MFEPLRPFTPVEAWVHALLRVPPYPHAPEGSPESIQVFRAGRNFYLWCMFVWLISNLAILAGLAGGFILISRIFSQLPSWAQIVCRVVESLAAIIFVAVAIFTFFSQRLNYLLRWYIITDRSLRIRTGIISLHELTMTFSNIQEIRVTAGPVQNLLGIADVEVHSAGGGSSAKGGDSGHIGRFEGVSNANAIRDLMVERLRHYRDSGLGEASTPAASSADDALAAARTVLAEARALRVSLT